MSTVPPPNRHAAASWVEKADEDIEAAELCLGAGLRLANVAAFHAQQAAEKLLKALIASTGSEPPRTHDLPELTERATASLSEVRALTDHIEGITSWAVVPRYPSQGDTPPPTVAEIGAMLLLIKQLRTFVTATAS